MLKTPNSPREPLQDEYDHNGPKGPRNNGPVNGTMSKANSSDLEQLIGNCERYPREDERAGGIKAKASRYLAVRQRDEGAS